jgi:hypothetical protein
MFQKRSLTAADGAELRALIEEMPDGDWRAVGIVRLDNKSEVHPIATLPTQQSLMVSPQPSLSHDG